MADDWVLAAVTQYERPLLAYVRRLFGDEHRGFAQRAAGALVEIAGEQTRGTCRGEGRADAFDQHGHRGANVKKAPSDQIPGGTWPSASAISASS